MGSYQKFRVIHYLISLNKRRRYVAHCLDFDLVTAADSLKEAERRLDVLVRLHIESFLRSNDPAALNGAAPNEFWSAYTDTLRKGKTLPPSTLRVSVPDVVPMHETYGELPV